MGFGQSIWLPVFNEVLIMKEILELQKDFDYYLAHQDELVKQFNNKFLVINNQKVFAAYDNELQAYLEAKKNFQPGLFMIQKCTSGDQDYTYTFHSRVSFN